MKNIKLLFALFFFTFSSFFSLGQSWGWGAAGYCSLGADVGFSPVSTTKGGGNVYTTGTYNTSITFGAHTLTSREYNAFLVKYDSIGNIIWAVQPISYGADCWASSVSTDNSGNIYICGYFMEGSIIFGKDTLKAGPQDEEDVFLAKYSPAGNALWAKQSRAFMENQNDAYSTATDKLDNVFITGCFQDSISFGNIKLKSPSILCPFLVKYDSSGSLLWATEANMPSSNCYSRAFSVFADNSGNAYIAGVYETAIFFGSHQLLSLNNDCPFLAKYSPQGNVLWAVQGNNHNGGGVGFAVASDGANNVYSAGEFWDSLQFGATILNSPAGDAAFLTKYDSNGTVLWAKQSSAGWAGTGLAIDGSNHIYLAGTNTISGQSVVFGSFSLPVVPWAAANAFLIKFDGSGDALCGSALENVGGPDEFVGITSDMSGKYVYMGSEFPGGDTVRCNQNTLYGTGYEQTFVGRWLNCAVDAGIKTIAPQDLSVSLYPNPSNGIFKFEISHPELVSGTQTIEIYNVLGEKMYSKSAWADDNSINLSNQPNGVYLYRVISENGELIGEGKLIIQR